MKVKINLSQESIDEARKKINDYNTAIKRKTTDLVNRLGDEGYNCVAKRLQEIHWTGELASSLGYVLNSNTAIISVDSEHAIFVEFGTGVVGSKNGHPPIDGFNYSYATGQCIGWYNVNGQIKFGWYYYNPELDRLVFTEGMEARPFMYESSLELRYEKMNRIVKEVFNDRS